MDGLWGTVPEKWCKMDDLRESHILGNLHMTVYNILQLTNYDYNPFPPKKPNTSKKQQRTMGE
jgi:hypothetical protein